MYTKHRWRCEKEWHDRNAQIIAMRLDKMTYREIGDHFGISQERVRQIIAKHLRRLRNEPFLTMAARRVIRQLLSEHTPIEVLRIHGIGRHTYEELRRWLAFGGREFDGRRK